MRLFSNKKNRSIFAVTILLFLILICLLINKYNNIKYNGNIKVSNVKITNKTVSKNSGTIEENNNTSSTISGNSELEYDINYKLDTKDGAKINGRTAIINVNLSDNDLNYASFLIVTDDNISSKIINSGKTLQIISSNITTDTLYQLTIKIKLTNAPNGYKISPTIDVSEATTTSSVVSGTEPATVNTNSLTGTVTSRESNANLDLTPVTICKVDEVGCINEKITYTNENGAYSFSDLKIGTYEVHAEDDENINVDIKDGNTILNLKTSQNKSFNPVINKYIKKIEIIDNNESKIYDYNKITKASLAIKNSVGASLRVIYEFDIINKGTSSGFVKTIREDIPNGMVLDTDYEENKDWVKYDKFLYNKKLSVSKLNPGEVKNVTIALKTNDKNIAKTYINNASINGEMYHKVNFIYNDEVIYQETVLDTDLVANKPLPTKDGYTVDGWYTSKDKSKKFDFNTPVNNDLYLYAIEKTNNVSITINNKLVPYLIKDEIKYNTPVNEPEKDNKVDGYTFKCFMELNSENETGIIDKDKYEKNNCYDFSKPVINDLNLIAVYTINNYKVRFLNKNSEGVWVDYITENTTSPFETNYGTKITKPTPDPTPDTLESFIGWFESEDEGQTFYTTSYNFNNEINKDVTLYANFDKAYKYYNVKYMVLGEEYETTSILANTSIGENQPSNPNIVGYKFNGWYDNETFTNEKYNFNSIVDSNLVLYAKMDKISNNVIFKEPKEGKIPKTPSDEDYEITNTVSIDYNDLVSVYEPEEKECSNFIGWFEKDNNGNFKSQPFDFSTKITKQIILYAVYETDKVNIKFLDSTGNLINEEQSVVCNTNPAVPTIDEIPNVDGKEFTCWDSDNEECKIDIPSAKEDKTYIAHYENIALVNINHTPTYWTNKVSVTMTMPDTKVVTEEKSTITTLEDGTEVVSTIKEEKEVTYDKSQYKIQYKIGDGEYNDYTTAFNVTENTIVYGRLVKKSTNEVSEEVSHRINNIDKVKPKIDILESSNMSFDRFDIHLKTTDLNDIEDVSGIGNIKLYLNDDENPFYDNNFDGNKSEEINTRIFNLEELTNYNIKVVISDKANPSNVLIDNLEVSTTEGHHDIVARIISYNDNDLDPSDYIEYYSLEEAVYGSEIYGKLGCNNGYGPKCTIQIVKSTNENVTVPSDLDVTIDLNGNTISNNVNISSNLTGYTDKISSATLINNGSKISIIDNSENSNGLLQNINENSVAIFNTNLTDSILTIGFNESDNINVDVNKPVVSGTMYGIYNSENSTLNYYDGLIKSTSSNTLSAPVYGEVTNTPYKYNATILDTSDDPSVPEYTKIESLKILSDAVARIKSTYYTHLNGDYEITAMKAIEKGTSQEVTEAKSIISENTNVSRYGFDYDANTNTLISNNSFIDSSVAETIIPIDLRSVSIYPDSTYLLRVNAEISSENNNDIGYLVVNKSSSSLTNYDSAFASISGNISSKNYDINLNSRDYYYLHIIYNKNDSISLNNDTMKINNVELIPSKLQTVTKEIITPGDYGFTYNSSTGMLTSNNQNIDDSEAYSYFEIDLTNDDSKDLTINYNIQSENMIDIGYITITEDSNKPDFSNLYDVKVSGDKSSSFTKTLESGKKYYVHMLYHKDEYTSYKTDLFNISFTAGYESDYKEVDMNNIVENISYGNYYNITSNEISIESNLTDRYFETVLELDLTSETGMNKLFMDAYISDYQDEENYVMDRYAVYLSTTSTESYEDDIGSTYSSYNRIFVLDSLSEEKNNFNFTYDVQGGKKYYLHICADYESDYKKIRKFSLKNLKYLTPINALEKNAYIENGDSINTVDKIHTVINQNEEADTIVLLQDIFMDESLIIDANTKVNLDLNGYNLSIVSSNNTINNSGDLTILDSGENGSVSNGTNRAIMNNPLSKIQINDSHISASNNVIDNYGELSYNENTIIESLASGTAINNYNLLINTSGKLRSKGNDCAALFNDSINQKELKDINIESSDGYGIRLSSTTSDGILIKNINIDSSRIGISTNNSSNISILNSNINNSTYGVEAIGNNILIENNNINNNSTGIILNGNNNIVNNVILTNNTTNGISVDGGKIIVKNSNITSETNGSKGINNNSGTINIESSNLKVPDSTSSVAIYNRNGTINIGNENTDLIEINGYYAIQNGEATTTEAIINLKNANISGTSENAIVNYGIYNQTGGNVNSDNYALNNKNIATIKGNSTLTGSYVSDSKRPVAINNYDNKSTLLIDENANIVGSINNNGSFTLGNNDEIVHKDFPKINGSIYAGFDFKYYDGILTDTENTVITKSVNEIPEGYDIKITKNINDNNLVDVTLDTNLGEIAVIVDKNTQEESLPYGQLQNAIDDANDGDTVKLISSFKTARQIDINLEKNIILETNGESINSYIRNPYISNNGILKITDNTTINDSTFICGSSKITSNVFNIISNQGNLTLENICFDAHENGIVDNSTTGNLTINNSEIGVQSGSYKYNPILNFGHIEFNSGKIYGKYGINNGTNSLKSGSLTINNGNIFASIYEVNHLSRDNLIINNVNSNFDNDKFDVYIDNSSAIANIKNGNFRSINNNNGTVTLEDSSFDGLYSDENIINNGTMNIKNISPKNASSSISINNKNNMTLSDSEIIGGENFPSIKNTGEMTLINNNIISNGDYSAINNSKKIIHKSGTIIGVLNNTGEFIFETGELDGNYKASTSANSDILVLGIKGDNLVDETPIPSKTNPKINGELLDSVNLKFYDGIITNGKENVLGNNVIVSETEDNYNVKIFESSTNKYSAILDKIPVVKITKSNNIDVTENNTFFDLESALNDARCESSCNIEFLADTFYVNSPNDINLNSNQSIKLDLNDHTFIIKNNKIINDGILKISNGKLLLKSDISDFESIINNNELDFNNVDTSLEQSDSTNDILLTNNHNLSITDSNIISKVNIMNNNSLNIKNSTINYVNSTGATTLNSSTVTTMINDGTLIQKSGTISNLKNNELSTIEKGKINTFTNSGTLNLGTENSNVNETDVVVQSSSINERNGNVNFYTGKIIGNYIGSISDVSDGYSVKTIVQNNQEIRTLTKEKAVKVGTKEFSSINEALSDNLCDSECTIELLRNVTILKNELSSIINEGKNITLDFAGYNINSGNKTAIKNKGTLTITDLSGSTNKQFKSADGILVANEGTFNLEKITMTTTRNDAVILNIGNGIFNQNSGIISGERDLIINTNKDNKLNATVNLNGGKIISNITTNTANSIYDDSLQDNQINVSHNKEVIYNSGKEINLNGVTITENIEQGSNISNVATLNILNENLINSVDGNVNVSGETSIIMNLNNFTSTSSQTSNISLNNNVNVINALNGTINISGGSIQLNKGRIQLSNTPSNYTISNKNNLKILKSVGDINITGGTLKITNGEFGIRSCGSLPIKAGTSTYTCESRKKITYEPSAFIIDNNIGTLDITGGTFQITSGSTDDIEKYIYGISLDNNSSLNIKNSVNINYPIIGNIANDILIENGTNTKDITINKLNNIKISDSIIGNLKYVGNLNTTSEITNSTLSSLNSSNIDLTTINNSKINGDAILSGDTTIESTTITGSTSFFDTRVLNISSSTLNQLNSQGELNFNGEIITDLTTSGDTLINAGKIGNIQVLNNANLDINSGVSTIGIITNKSTGTININDGDIEAIINSNSGTINVNECNVGGIKNTSNGTINISSNAVINNPSGAGIESSGNGTINIGTNDDTLDITKPTITGSTYGVVGKKGIINFYDGVITGKNGISIYGTINYDNANYSIKREKTEELYEKAYLVEVGEIDISIVANGQGYIDLQTAINSSPDTTSDNPVIIYLTKDYTLNGNVIVPSGKNISLYKNNHQLNYSEYSISGDGVINIFDGEVGDSSTQSSGLGATIRSLLNIDNPINISKNIILYTTDNGQALLSSNTYELYLLSDGKYEKVDVVEDENNVGRYSIATTNSNDVMVPINGRLYINNVPDGTYKVKSNNSDDISFVILEDGKLSGNVRLNNTDNLSNYLNSSSAQVIVGIQTGQVAFKFGLLSTLIIIIIGLLQMAKNQNEERRNI